MSSGKKKVPDPTWIMRFTHADNLRTIVTRGAMHAPNHMPSDGQTLRLAHDPTVQAARAARSISKGPGGTVHDYVPFYFGPFSPMMLNLKTGRVSGYTEGQRPLIYLVASAQDIASAGIGFVFTDGQALSRISQQFDDLGELGQVDWEVVRAKYWRNTSEDPDKQRRKQAEFLVFRSCPWQLVRVIAVFDHDMKGVIEEALCEFDDSCQRPVRVRRDFYFD